MTRAIETCETPTGDETMFKITYTNHDSGNASCDGWMKRDTIERAEHTAKLMRECGYQKVVITKIA